MIRKRLSLVLFELFQTKDSNATSFFYRCVLINSVALMKEIRCQSNSLFFFFLWTRLINASYECNLSRQVEQNLSETLVYDSVKFIANLRSMIRVLFVQQNQPNQLRLFRYTQQVRFIARW